MVQSQSVDSTVAFRIAGLMRQVQFCGGDADIGLALDELTAGAANLIPHAQYAAVTVTSEEGDVDTPSTTHRYPAVLDDIAHRTQQGPVLEATRGDVPVRLDDLEADTRWPEFRAEALTRTPIRSIVALPLVSATRTIGALTVYADRVEAYDDDAIQIASAYATHASLVWDALRRKEQFTVALSSRDLIGQSKGMLMERYDCSAGHAFGLLKKLSQETNTPLRDVARRLVGTDHPYS